MSEICGREHKVVIPLQPVVVEEPFEQWGIDIIGEINPHSSKTTQVYSDHYRLFHMLD
jgi:hypothetical protein